MLMLLGSNWHFNVITTRRLLEAKKYDLGYGWHFKQVQLLTESAKSLIACLPGILGILELSSEVCASFPTP
jgi:hypothetical protein